MIPCRAAPRWLPGRRRRRRCLSLTTPYFTFLARLVHLLLPPFPSSLPLLLQHPHALACHHAAGAGARHGAERPLAQGAGRGAGGARVRQGLLRQLCHSGRHGQHDERAGPGRRLWRQEGQGQACSRWWSRSRRSGWRAGGWHARWHGHGSRVWSSSRCSAPVCFGSAVCTWAWRSRRFIGRCSICWRQRRWRCWWRQERCLDHGDGLP